jgi:ATPase subunit of ABC transporter with duplicated ATPase domains
LSLIPCAALCCATLQTQGLAIADKLNIRNDKLYRKVNSLSGGEKKRVGLSAALLKQPDVLLLDEVSRFDRHNSSV